MKVVGKIRWFNKLSGEGAIRLSNGKSIQFFACNVEGANSHYPHLVTNVDFIEGESVTALVPDDPYLARDLGLIEIKKISGGN